MSLQISSFSHQFISVLMMQAEDIAEQELHKAHQVHVAGALGLQSAAAIAHILGRKPCHLYRQAAQSAMASGFCGQDQCVPRDLAKWALAQGQDLGGPLGAYARGFSGAATGGKITANAVARARGLDPKKMFLEAQDKAWKSGYGING